MKEELVKLFSTGKYDFGVRNAKRKIFSSEAKLILISNNVPKLIKKELENLTKLKAIPLIEINMNSVELGKYLGRAHAINIITVVDLGTADIQRIRNGNN